LHRYQHELRALTSQVISVEMHERERLATILHEHIGQLLALARFRVDEQDATAPTPYASNAWHEMASLLQRIISASRAMTFELFPPPLYESGIAAALRWLTRELTERHGVQCTFTTNIDFDHRHTTIRDFVYWSARELLLNVIRHANARQAQVTLQQQEENIIITVRDDGCGFHPSMHDRPFTLEGFGLFSIRERLQLLGGSCRIDSSPGQGTCVTLTVAMDMLSDSHED
jgi:signal transduction histidine kinase